MEEINKNMPVRDIKTSRPFSKKRFFLQWEWMLVFIFVAVNIMNASLSSNYLNMANLMSAIQMFSDKAVLVFPMMLVILLGEIDISVASTMALSATVMGVSYEAGAPMGVAILIALIVGAVCGLINGVILAKYNELASMIVTLATQIIFRGVASIILEDGAVGNFPDWFQFLGWGYVGPIPFILIFFIVEGLIFAYVIHFTKFGRRVYAMGNNITASEYSGVEVNKIKIIIFTILGIFGAVAGIFLASKMGSVRPSIAKGYELDVIAMVVLGGVINTGGKGRVIGVVISTFIVGLLRYGLGLFNVPSQTILIIVGALLIVAVAIPNLKSSMGDVKFVKKFLDKQQK